MFCTEVFTPICCVIAAYLTLTSCTMIAAGAAGIAAKQNYTDKDIVDFLVNVECVPLAAWTSGCISDLVKLLACFHPGA